MNAGSTSCASGSMLDQGELRPRLCPTTCIADGVGGGGEATSHEGGLSTCCQAHVLHQLARSMLGMCEIAAIAKSPSGALNSAQPIRVGRTLCSSSLGSSGLVGLMVLCCSSGRAAERQRRNVGQAAHAPNAQAVAVAVGAAAAVVARLCACHAYI